MKYQNAIDLDQSAIVLSVRSFLSTTGLLNLARLLLLSIVWSLTFISVKLGKSAFTQLSANNVKQFRLKSKRHSLRGFRDMFHSVAENARSYLRSK